MPRNCLFLLGQQRYSRGLTVSLTFWGNLGLEDAPTSFTTPRLLAPQDVEVANSVVVVWRVAAAGASKAVGVVIGVVVAAAATTSGQ